MRLQVRFRAHRNRNTERWWSHTKYDLPAGGRDVSVCRAVCVTGHLMLVSMFTCEDGFGTSGLIDSTVSVEVNVAVSSSQAERCRRQTQNTQTE